METTSCGTPSPLMPTHQKLCGNSAGAPALPTEALKPAATAPAPSAAVSALGGSQQDGAGSGGSKTGAIVGGVVGALLGLPIFLAAAFFLIRRRRLLSLLPCSHKLAAMYAHIHAQPCRQYAQAWVRLNVFFLNAKGGALLEGVKLAVRQTCMQTGCCDEEPVCQSMTAAQSLCSHHRTGKPNLGFNLAFSPIPPPPHREQ